VNSYVFLRIHVPFSGPFCLLLCINLPLLLIYMLQCGFMCRFAYLSCRISGIRLLDLPDIRQAGYPANSVSGTSLLDTCVIYIYNINQMQQFGIVCCKCNNNETSNPFFNAPFNVLCFPWVLFPLWTFLHIYNC